MEYEGKTAHRNGTSYVFSRHPSAVIRNQHSDGYPFMLQAFRENLLSFKRALYPEQDTFAFKRITKAHEIPHLDLSKPVYLDIETNGLNPFKKDARIWCLSFCQEPDKTYAVYL